MRRNSSSCNGTPSLPLSAGPSGDFAKSDDYDDLASLSHAVWQHRRHSSGSTEQAITRGQRSTEWRNRPISRFSWLFCQQRLHPKLDNRRRRWKNTHELIILPVTGGFYRPTWLPAWPFAGCPLLACGSGNSNSLSGETRAASTPPGLSWARGIRRNLGFGSSYFVADPDRVSAADIRYTSAE